MGDASYGDDHREELHEELRQKSTGTSAIVAVSRTELDELHRRLARSDEMRRGAEAQCERYRKELLELKRNPPAGNFFDAMVFIESLKHCNGHVDRAITMTREILSKVDAAGGIRGDGDTT